MLTNDCIEAAVDELRSVGIEPNVRHGGKHITITWKAGATDRTVHTSATPSDFRAEKNMRHQVRRMLRDDGLIAAETEAEAGDRPRLFLSGGVFHCNSRDLAAHFGKQHKNVLRDIDRLKEDLGEEYGRLNFEPSSYLNEQGKQQRCFNLSRDGFTLLAMGFSGADAIAWKVRYLEAFNAMESELRKIPALGPAPEVLARIERLEGDLAALIDLSLVAPTPEPGFIVVKAYKRRMRRAA